MNSEVVISFSDDTDDTEDMITHLQNQIVAQQKEIDQLNFVISSIHDKFYDC